MEDHVAEDQIVEGQVVDVRSVQQPVAVEEISDAGHAGNGQHLAGAQGAEASPTEGPTT